MSPLNALIAQGFGAPQWDLQQAQQNALTLRAMQRQEQMAPEEMNWLRETRRMKREQFGWERDKAKTEQEQWAREKEKQPMKDEAEALKYFQSVGPMLSLKNYQQSREWMIKKNGFNPALLPDISDIITSAAERGVNPEEFFEAWKFNTLTTMGQRIDLLKKEKELRSKQIEAKEKAKPELQKLIEKRNSLPAGSPDRKDYDNRIKKLSEQTEKLEARPEIEKVMEKYKTAEDSEEKAFYLARLKKLTESSNLQVRVNKDGSIELIQGPGAGTMAKKTEGAIEEKILGGKEQIARMQQISESFKPEYLETGTRLQAAWTGIKAKLGQNVSPKDTVALTDFKKFQRKSIENINLYIKEFTGAQMSEQEATRLRLSQPDPGEKWYQGDDPITFKAKMDDVVKSARAAVARYEYYKAKGLSEPEIKGLINSNKAISLDEISKRMQ